MLNQNTPQFNEDILLDLTPELIPIQLSILQQFVVQLKNAETKNDQEKQVQQREDHYDVKENDDNRQVVAKSNEK